MILKKIGAAVFAPFVLAAPLLAARPALACGDPMTTSRSLLMAALEKSGCPAGNVPGNDLFTTYCRASASVGLSLGEEPVDISSIAETDPEGAILALRGVPDHDKGARDLIARAAALDLARAAVETAFYEKDQKHLFLKQAHESLSDMLEKLSDWQITPGERDRLHKKAYALRLTLEDRDFKSQYVMAAQAVVTASAASDTGGVSAAPGTSTDTAWISLYRTSQTLKTTLDFNARATAGPGENAAEKARQDSMTILHRVMMRRLT